MGKKGNIILALAGIITGGGAFFGERIYRETISAKRDSTKRADTGRLLPADTVRRDVYLNAIDGLRLHAVSLSAEEVPATGSHTAVIFHDAQGVAEDVFLYAAHYLDRGMNVLVPELRGCGLSEGNYMGYGYDDRLDVLTWVHWILKRDPDARILLHGLGAGADAVLMAMPEHLPGAVYACVSDSAFTSLREYLLSVMKRSDISTMPVTLRLFLLRLMTRIRAGYDIRAVSPLKAVRRAQTPTLFLHGDADLYVPVEMCTRLYNAAQCARQISVFLSAGHIKSVEVSPERYWGQIDAFIAKYHPDRI